MFLGRLSAAVVCAVGFTLSASADPIRGRVVDPERHPVVGPTVRGVGGRWQIDGSATSTIGLSLGVDALRESARSTFITTLPRLVPVERGTDAVFGQARVLNVLDTRHEDVYGYPTLGRTAHVRFRAALGR